MDIPANVTCTFCGSEPARVETIRRHVGMLLLQRFIKFKRPACRTCGQKVLKEYTLKTLWQGWWGYISFFVNWFVLAMNLVAYFQLRGLGQPRPAAAVPAASKEQWRSAFAAETDGPE